MPHFYSLIAVKVAANNRERWFSGLTLCQREPLCSVISEVMDGHLKTLCFVIHFILLLLMPAWEEGGALDKHYFWRQNWTRLNGSYWVYVRVKVLSEHVNRVGRMDAHGFLLFDLSLTPEALLKEMPHNNRSGLSFARRPPPTAMDKVS